MTTSGTLTIAARAVCLILLLPTLWVAPSAQAEEGVDVLLEGGGGPDTIHVSLSEDGTSYLISSSTALQGGGAVCSAVAGDLDRLGCRAAAVSGFEFDGGPGDDSVVVAPKVAVPVTLRGGPGNDLLVGGGGADLLLGGAGEDVLVGGPGDDRLVGGPGDDLLVGGPGRDTCISGGGEDAAVGCDIEKGIAVKCASPAELQSAARTPCALWGRRHPASIERLAQIVR